jgi:hypothetical protein
LAAQPLSELAGVVGVGVQAVCVVVCVWVLLLRTLQPYAVSQRVFVLVAVVRVVVPCSVSEKTVLVAHINADVVSQSGLRDSYVGFPSGPMLCGNGVS